MASLGKYGPVRLGREFSGASDNSLHRLLPEQLQDQDCGFVTCSRLWTGGF